MSQPEVISMPQFWTRFPRVARPPTWRMN